MQSRSRWQLGIAVGGLLLAALACSPLPYGRPGPTPASTAASPQLSATAPAEASVVTSSMPTATTHATQAAEPASPTAELPTAEPPTAEPAPTEPAVETYIAYAQDNAVLVTHVMAGQALDTRVVAESQPNEWVTDITWSPSGEYLSFARNSGAFPHQFYVNLLSGGAPVDLGIAGEEGASWSPDSKLLAFVQEYELVVHSVADGRTRRLTNHLGYNWLWGKPVFTPAGDALVAAGTVYADMDRRSGNTPFKLYRVPLDGSAAGSYPTTNMSSLTEEMTGRMQMAMSFSPDGQKLAFSTWQYIDSCGSLAAYYVANADGSGLRVLPVASLAAVSDPDGKLYFFGDSLVWTHNSEGLWLKGQVRDCNFNSRMAGGPQISHVTLDGQEHEIIPGKYGAFLLGELSLDRSGTLLGAMNTSGAVPRVQILGIDGRLVLDLGEGELAALQP